MSSLHKAASSSLRYPVKQSFGLSSKHIRNTRAASNTAQNVQETNNIKIVIPKRIERGPTDILKALSSTVKRDYTAPHYKYHDDPFLIPTSNISKRMYALSQESGRKAAQWIRQEHADLFQHKVADPPIEAFFPKAVYDDKSEVDESVLQKLISQYLITDSLTVYGLLEEKGIELTRATKQSLLELICYYNAVDMLDEDWIEERWFRQGVKSKERRMNSWMREGSADKLFQSLSPPDSASYSALLCGKAQFGDVDGAYKLYLEATDAGLGLHIHAFNKLITGSIVLKESHELRWQFVEEMLGAMMKQGVSPNLGTLNAILETLVSMSVNKFSQKRSLDVIAEFKELGINPSLASYNFLMHIFCNERSNAKSAILVSILDVLQGKSLEIQDPRDVVFFTEAMNNCRYYLADLDAAYKLDKLLHTANNYNLIGDSLKESIYYRNFFAIVCQMGTLQEFMDLYNKLVPNIYVPEPGIMEVIIKTVELNEAPDLLPRLWSDLVMFDYSERGPLLLTLLTALKTSHSTDNALLNQHADVAWAIWQKVNNQKEDRTSIKRIELTGPMIGDIVQVLLRADRYDLAYEIMECLDKRQQEILGVPSIECLTIFLDHSIEKKKIKNALWCIQYCSEAGFEETEKLAQKLAGCVELSDNDQAQLVKIVGHNALKQKAVTSS